MVDVYSIAFKADSREVKQAKSDFEGLGRQTKASGNSVDKFGRQVNDSSKKVRGMGGAATVARKAVTALGAALSVNALKNFANGAINAADQIDNLSRTAGVSADTLQELRFAFGQLAGTTDTEVDAALRRFNRRLGLAADGGGAAKDTFEQLGIALQNSAGGARGTEQVLDDLINRLGDVDNDSRRAALASQAFGEDAGPRLAAAIGKGTGAVNELRDSARILENDLVASGSRIRDELDELFGDIQTEFQRAFLGFAQENEEDIRDLFAAMVRGSANVVRFSDEIGGPLGAGVMGYLLFGKKGAIIGTLITAAFQTVDSLIDRLNENSGEALLRLEQRAQQLQATIDSQPAAHPVTRAALADLERVEQKIKELEDARINSVSVENQYQTALEESSSVTDDLANSLDSIADRFQSSGQAAEESATSTKKAADAASQYSDALSNILGTSIKIPGPIEDISVATKKAADDAEDLGDTFEEVADKVENAFSDAFYDIFTEGFDSFSNLADDIFDIFRRTLADMAAAAIRQQIVIPITQQIVGSAGGVVSGIGQAATGGGFGGIGSALTSPGFGGNLAGQFAMSGIGQSLGLSGAGAAGLPPGAFGGRALTQTGANVTNAFGAASSLAGIGGGFIGGQLGGGTLESNIGSTLGTIAGGFLGPVGSFVGGILGGLFGGLFGGDDEPDPSRLNVRTTGARYGSQTTGSLRAPLSRSDTKSLVNDLFDSIRDYIEAVDSTVESAMDQSLKEVLGGETVSVTYRNLVEDYFTGDDADPQKGLNVIFQRLSKQLGKRIPGVFGDSLVKISNSADGFVERFDAVSQIVATSSQPVLNELGDFAKGVDKTGDEFVQSLINYNNALRQLEQRGDIDLAGQITGQGTQTENIQAYIQTANAVDEVTFGLLSQQEQAKRTKESLEDFSRQLGLSQDEFLTSSDSLRDYLTSLDLTSQSGRQAAGSAIQLRDAIDLVERAAERATEQQERAAEVQERLVETRSRLEKEIADERFGLETQLLQLQGETEELRNRELNTLFKSNRELQQRIFNLQDEQEEQQRLARISQERQSLERQILQIQGDTQALRELELAGLDQSNRALQQRIFNLQDEQAEEQRREEARREREQRLAQAQQEREQRLAQVAQERESLERSLLQLQGDTQALRNLELKELDSSNRSLQRRIFALQDEQEEQQQLSSIYQDQLSVASSLADAWKNATRTLRESADEILGVGGTSGVGIQTQFQQTLQRALSGDQSAFQELPGLGQELSEFSTQQAGSLTEARRQNAIIAADLDKAADFAEKQFNEFASEAELAQKQLDSLKSQEESLNDVSAEVRMAREALQRLQGIEQADGEGFANGGIASGPMSGYNATLHGTEAVIPLNGQRIPLEVNNQEMIQEIRDLRTEVKQLKDNQEQSQYELVKFTKRNNRQLEQFDIEGLPPTREEA